MKTLLTIFTPTYNRAYLLPQLYKSLLGQTNQSSVEWLIVDDGSVDDTEELVKQWEKEGAIKINYIKTPNGGKQRAINEGVLQAKGELFFIVDSDDFLTTDAVEKIHTIWQYCKGQQFGGLLLRKILNGEVLGKPFPYYEFKANSLEVAYKYGVKQDKAEIFVTEKLKEFPFPVAKDEKFVPEAYIWNRLTKKYPLWCVDEAIYCCEYLPDGYSHNLKKNFKENPKGFAMYYKDVLRYKEVPVKEKAKALIRYFQMQYYRLCKRKN